MSPIAVLIIVIAALVHIGIPVLAWLAFRTRVASDWYRGPVSDHFDGVHFFNRGAPRPELGPHPFLRWKLARGAAQWPVEVPVSPIVPALRVDSEAMVATIVGHACVLVQTQGLNILTDPVWSQRASPFQWLGPKRVRAPGVAFDDLPKIDIVLLSHNHYDHLDLATLKRLWARDAPRIITPLGNAALLTRHGVTATEADWGDTVEAAGVSIHIDAVQHWAARWGFDRDRALWCGFTVALPGGNLFFAGDCGYHQAYFAAAARHGPLRLALLPIGAYEPRWFMQYSHMNPDDAVAAFNDLAPAHAIGIHWGVWQLTDEAIDAPREALDAALAAAAIDPARFRPGIAGTEITL